MSSLTPAEDHILNVPHVDTRSNGGVLLSAKRVYVDTLDYTDLVELLEGAFEMEHPWMAFSTPSFAWQDHAYDSPKEFTASEFAFSGPPE